MTTSTAAPKKGSRKGSPARKAATRPAGSSPGSNGSNGSNGAVFAAPAPEEFVPLPQEDSSPAVPAEPKVPDHPYGSTKVFSYDPKDGSPPIVLPHISTCIPDALFLYDNRNKDELRQCFAWMDRAGVPDEIGRRVWMLPPGEQAAIVSGWFSGLVVNGPQGVAPPGES